MEETGYENLPVFLGKNFKFKPGESPLHIDRDPREAPPIDGTITIICGDDPGEGEIIATRIVDETLARLLVQAYVMALEGDEVNEVELWICWHVASRINASGETEVTKHWSHEVRRFTDFDSGAHQTHQTGPVEDLRSLHVHDHQDHLHASPRDFSPNGIFNT